MNSFGSDSVGLIGTAAFNFFIYLFIYLFLEKRCCVQIQAQARGMCSLYRIQMENAKNGKWFCDSVDQAKLFISVLHHAQH